MGKSTYKKDDLIAAIIRMRIQEMAATSTILYFLTEDIGMHKVTAYQYIKWAREQIKEIYSFNNPAAIEEAIGQYEEALEVARQKKDWKGWRELRREYNKIVGVYAKKEIDITSDGKAITEVNINIIKPNE